MSKRKRIDLQPGKAWNSTTNPFDPNFVYNFEQKVNALYEKVDDIKKVQTPFGLFLHNPLIFVAVWCFGFVIAGVVAYFFLYKGLDAKQIELSTQVQELDAFQKEQYRDCLNNIIKIIKQKE